MNIKKHLRQSLSTLMTFTIFIIGLQACNDPSINTGVETNPPPQQQTSHIDGNPIVTMDASSFYSAEAEYLKNTRQTLAENGQQVIKALQTKRFNGAQTAATGYTPVTEVELYELSGFSDGRGTQSGSLADLSGHVRITNPEGDIEEFYMSITPHLPPVTGNNATQKNTSMQKQAAADEPSSQHAYIALDVDQFYVTEDENGDEIWPVTIPAQSLSDPDEVIEVTLHEGGRLEWPEEISSSSTSKTNKLAFSPDPELNYLSAEEMAIQDPDGGSGGFIPEETANVTLQEKVSEVEVLEAGFLSLKSIRLEDRSDGNLAEISMHMGYDQATPTLEKKWTYIFDQKIGRFGQKDGFFSRVFNGVKMVVRNSLFSIVTGGGFSFEPSTIVNELVEPVAIQSDVFEGKNHRTIAADMAVYEVPDINREGVTYTFENMKTWNIPLFDRGVAFNTPLHINDISSELLNKFNLIKSRADYFPIVPLNRDRNNNKWMLILSESDKKKEKFSTRRLIGNERNHTMWVYDMATSLWDQEKVTIETGRHAIGGSDDFVNKSAVKNISTPNIKKRFKETNGELKISKGEFEYVMTISDKKILCTK